MQFKAIIFDFDGVLADTLEDMLRFAAQACEQLGIPCQPSPVDLEVLERMTFSDFGRQLGVPENKLGEFVRLCLELFSNRAQPPDITPGLGEVVRQLAQTYPLAIVTGNTEATVRAFLERHDLADCFKVLVDVHQPGERADKITRAAAALGVDPSETLVVGDAVSDVRAAAQAGARSAAVGWGHQSHSRLSQAGPDYLVSSPTGLLEFLPMENEATK